MKQEKLVYVDRASEVSAIINPELEQGWKVKKIKTVRSPYKFDEVLIVLIKKESPMPF